MVYRVQLSTECYISLSVTHCRVKVVHTLKLYTHTNTGVVYVQCYGTLRCDFDLPIVTSDFDLDFKSVSSKKVIGQNFVSLQPAGLSTSSGTVIKDQHLCYSTVVHCQDQSGTGSTRIRT